MSAPRIGYLLKCFPRVSETFIAQEVLELERLGTDVHIVSLTAPDRPAAHGWLRQLRAPILRAEPAAFADVWGELGRRVRKRPDRRDGIRRAVCVALEQHRRGRRSLAEALAVADIMARYGIHHLHAHFANRPALVALLAGAISGRPFSFTAHAKDIYRDTVDRDYWRRLLENAAFAVTVSKANLEFLRALTGPLADGAGRRLRLIHNGVDLERLQPAPRPAQVNGTRLKLLCVARLVEKKGVDVLLTALRQVLDEGSDVDAAIVGDGPLASALRQRADALRLDERVAFLGSVPHERVIELMHESACLVLPCRIAADGDRDALPTVLLEATACGLPCISTRIGGVPEIIEHEATGLVVAPEQPAELAAAIRRLVRDAALRHRFGLAGRRRAEERFDRRHAVARLRSFMCGEITPPVTPLQPAAGARPAFAARQPGARRA